MLGYDVGGANTKAAFVSVKNGKLLSAKVAVEYFPVWKQPEKLANVLLTLKQRLGASRLDGLGVTMTAELSDAYQTKREGVHHILDCVKKAFPDVPVYVLNTDAKLESSEVAKQKPLRVAAANWVATGWLVAQHLKTCVVVDVGSTSTSIIPIANGQVAARGKTDLDKLICGELVYTGSLRTNVAAIVQAIPIRQGIAGVASELFALSCDVHLVVGNLTEKDYNSETADGRGKTVPEALARLARVVCADTEMLTRQEIINMAQFICDKQIRQVAESLTKVYSYAKSLSSGKVSVVVTGLGKDFIARKAAETAGVDSIVDLGALLPEEAVLATPAFGVALMAATKLEGEIVK
ncbi:MAG: H4MPT-linked C1 transfer pathway protein [Chloroflexi bacterium]|nr:H4MPT-linked C1 transfer pathway protein [Chloroflexota bacterium]